jgi:hypothetical protein
MSFSYASIKYRRRRSDARRQIGVADFQIGILDDAAAIAAVLAIDSTEHGEHPNLGALGQSSAIDVCLPLVAGLDFESLTVQAIRMTSQGVRLVGVLNRTARQKMRRAAPQAATSIRSQHSHLRH